MSLLLLIDWLIDTIILDLIFLQGDGSSVDAPPSKNAEELKSVGKELEDAKERK